VSAGVRSTISSVDASIVLEPSEVEATGTEPTGVAGAELLAVAADPVRWRLLSHLAGGGSRCVCELQPIANVAGNLLSYHLKVLREAGLVSAEKRGRWVHYTIAADALDRLHGAVPHVSTSSAGGR
jgi:ArsR family transcriptional regulator